MAKPAEIDLILNTKPAIDEAKKFSPKLEKALTTPVKGNDRIRQMKKDIRDLTGEVSTSAKESREKFEEYGKGVDELAKKAERYEEIQKRLAEIDKDKNYKQAKKDLAQGKVEEKQGFEGAGDKIEDATNRLKPYSDEIANLKAESKQLLDEISTGLDALPVKLGQMKQEAEAFVAKGELVNANEEKVSQLVSEVIGEKQEVNQLTNEQASQEEGNVKALEQEANAQQGVTDAVKQTTENAGEVANALEDVAGSADTASSSSEGMSSGLQDAESSAGEVADVMGEIDAESSNIAGKWQSTGSPFAKAKLDIERLYGYFQYLKSGAASLHDLFAFATAKKSVGELYQKLMELNAAKKQLEANGIGETEQKRYAALINEIDRTKAAIREYKQEVKNTKSTHADAEKAGKAFAKGVSSAVKGLKSGIKGTESIVKNLVRVLKSGLSSVSKVTGKIKSSFNSMSSSMRSNFKHLITSITKYILGFRSLFFLVRRLRKYVGEGIQNLVQFNDGNNLVNESITRLLSSLLFLKNAWAAAFSPIITFVTGWLELLIDKLAEVGNAVARLIGRLTGQTVVFNAVKVGAQDYAESLDGVGSSAKGAADKTKKLTDRLAAFDDLNVLGKDNDDDKDGSGGGGGGDDSYIPDPNEMFKIVESGQDLLQKLKDMWKSADFTELGTSIQTGIVTALKSINWPEIQQNAYKLGSSIATFLNGVFADDSLWVQAGTTLAEAINTMGEFAFGLLSKNKVDWGGNFAKFISEWFNSIDMDTVQANLYLLGQEIVDNINSFFENLELDEEGVTTLAKSLTNFVVTIITGIDLEQIKTALAPIGTSVLDGISQALSTSDNPFFNSAGELFDKLRQSIEEKDPSILASAVTTLIVNAISGINWGEIINAFAGFGDAILTGIQQGLEGSDNPIMQSIGSMIGNLKEALPELLPVLSQVFDVLLQIVTAVLPVITSVLPVITDLITLLSPILQLIAEVITMISPIITDLVTAILPVLQSVIETLMPYIQQIIEAILPVVLNLLQALQPVFETIITAILPIVVQLLDALMPIIQIILGCVDELIEPITQLLPPILQLIGEILPPLISFLMPIVKLVALMIELAVSLLAPIIELIAPLIQLLADCLSPIFEFLGLIGDIIEAIVIPIFGELTALIKVAVIPILKVLVAVFEVISAVIGGAGKVLSEFVSNCRTKVQELGDIFKGFINKMLSNVESAVNAIINGINGLLEKLNAVKFDVPDWVPAIGGQQWGFNVNYLNTVSIPRLAQGAVIPPNREFMAILGDQSHGTNVEAPLDTIKQAVAEVLANNNNQEVIQLLQQLIRVVEDKELVVGDKEIGKANARYINKQRIIRGTSF